MAASPIRTAAALLVDCLAAEQVEYVFSVPGEETMDILEALSRQDAVRHITTRHEQGAAFMADVYGRLTGRASVAMSTLGPGATNLVTGIADAYLDRAPMVALTGQAGSDKTHKEAHQFVDIVRMLEPVTKWNQRVGQTAAIPEIMRKAFRVAQLAKPGPTHVELPENLAAMMVDADLQPIAPTNAYFPEPTDEAIAHAARLLAGSSRPLVLAGNGVIRRHAAPELRAFARGLHVPVAVTFMGKGAIDDRSHLSLMAVGLQARDHVLSGFDRADVVMSVGYDLVEYAPARWNPDGHKRIVHIDTQPAEVDAFYQPEVELIGDIGGTLRRLGVDVDDPFVPVRVPAIRRVFDEVVSDRHHHVGPVEPGQDVIARLEPDGHQRKMAPVVDRALSHERHGHRHVEPAGERPQLGGGVATDHAVACEDKRPARSGEQPRRVRDRLVGGLREVGV